MALTSKLTNIAEAIRSKTGGTDALTLDGMAAAIAAIEAGGGGGFVTGTFTLASNTTGYAFAENIEKEPDIIFVYKNEISAEADYSWLILASVKISGTCYQVGLRNTASLGVIKSSSEDTGWGAVIRYSALNKTLVCHVDSYVMIAGTYTYMYA